MENDFIPGNTPQGNRTTLHLLFLLLSSISHRHSLILPKPLSKIILSFLDIFVLMIHTYTEDWRNLDAVTVGVSVCVYVNKCVIWFHWHYPTQRDNNVTFLTTLCILLEYPALCQDAQACSSRLSNMLPLPTTNKINPYTVAVLSWWMIIGGCVWKNPLYRKISRDTILGKHLV